MSVDSKRCARCGQRGNSCTCAYEMAPLVYGETDHDRFVADLRAQLAAATAENERLRRDNREQWAADLVEAAAHVQMLLDERDAALTARDLAESVAKERTRERDAAREALRPARKQLSRLLADLEGEGVGFGIDEVRRALNAVETAMSPPSTTPAVKR